MSETHNPLMQETLDRTRRIEAKVSNIIKYLGFDPTKDTRLPSREVVYDHSRRLAMVSTPAVSLGELMAELRMQGVSGKVEVMCAGRVWGYVDV